MWSALRRRPGAFLAAAGILLAFIGRGSVEIAAFREWHRVVLLPFVARVHQPLSGVTTGTIGELLAVSLGLLAIAGLIRRRGRAVGPAVFAVGALVLLFYTSWGVAYRYPALGTRLAPVSGDDGDAELILRTRQVARLLTTATVLDEPSSAGEEATLASINLALTRGFNALPEELEAAPVHALFFGPAKFSRVSWALSRLQLSGYYFPWTGEAQINREMPRSLWPRVAAHEKAHQRGFARENEATVIGLLACLAAEDAPVRYSGTLGLYVALDREIARIDSEARRLIWESLPTRVASDLRTEARFWKRFDGPAARVSEKVNDTYLKTQGVRSGIESYSETTRLLLQAIETPSLILRARLEDPALR